MLTGATIATTCIGTALALRGRTKTATTVLGAGYLLGGL